MVSEISAVESRAAAGRGELRYAAESAADRAFWLLLADRRRFSNRDLGTMRVTREDSDEEGWMADGSPRTLEVGECSVEVRILDAAHGLDLSGRNPDQELRKILMPSVGEGEEPDQAVVENLDRFLDILADYIDPNDLVRLNGMEMADYEAEGLFGLPRNAALQYREEALWLPGLRDVVPRIEGAGASGYTDLTGQLRIIPPQGSAFPRRSDRPSFFATSPELLQQILGLSRSELEAILRARKSWQQEQAALDESLDPDLIGSLRSRFSFTESGIVTLQVTATRAGLRRSLSLTRDAQETSVRYQQTRPWLVNWEKRWE
jgi:hypothetical protein